MDKIKRMPDPLDPRGLIRESYNIDGITEAECRSIFLDWAIGVPMDENAKDHIERLLVCYADAHPDHPMTMVLRHGLGNAKPARRGGRRGRAQN